MAPHSTLDLSGTDKSQPGPWNSLEPTELLAAKVRAAVCGFLGASDVGIDPKVTD